MDLADSSLMIESFNETQFWLQTFALCATILSVIFGLASLVKWPIEMFRAVVFVLRSGQRGYSRRLIIASLATTLLAMPFLASWKPLGISQWVIAVDAFLIWQIVVHQLWRRVQGKPIGDLRIVPERRTHLSSPEFYSSREWLDLRYRVLRKYGRECMLCRSAQGSMHVDHIKPRSKYPHLELEFSNIQVLCPPCNFGKSNKYEDDFRSA